jgi:ribosomal protein S18 acetylase RimI-like enzyme
LAIEVRQLEPGDNDAVRAFLASVGWAERVRDQRRFVAMLENASRAVVALDGERVVGFARALCDEVSNGYISMVAVAEDCRRQGIGRRLVDALIAPDDGTITWVLRAGRGSEGFWRQLGFSPSVIAMERLRR